MITAYCLFLWLMLTLSSICSAHVTRKWRVQESRRQILDFRYNSARIDGITRLFNDSLIVISNGHYWFLDKGELPRVHNVKGPISQLFPGFKQIDDIWTDPYNDISPQIYLASNASFYVHLFSYQMLIMTFFISDSQTRPKSSLSRIFRAIS